MTAVTSHEQLRALLGEPAKRAAEKDRKELHQLDRDWLAAAPFCLIATAGADGSCDVSPKGDPAGFTLVLDDTTIAIPERPGNKRADGFHNIIDNPHVGLIYLIPGRTDTLRINGRATILADAPWFDELAVKGHRPQFALRVEIEQIFYHCAKAFLRSELWKPDTWQPDALPRRAVLIKEVERPADTLADLDRHYGPDYAKNLY
ncbi:pyridoxamine 5'-phosphate oxidase family protein [Asanoa sp. WMMD1127]|uniref:pyridoxamine 5'-phosphate oxidase family protein n=1 Tax=Asanoa sp. WMMD1127 TaxID=3016107 RepID=UPI002416394F|nr:pyridoxamine 5'-phosphate oxidase family protein [Asanoa sp. WMMD1127]MDG4823138.1 pyridoxamine 5'-phosphate oxidase family protein [Asanoa sp. WMMD1127]